MGNPWKTRLSILTLAHVVGTIHIVSVLAMAPVIQRELDLSVTEFGLLMTAYNGAQSAGAIPAGGLVDRYGVGWALALAHVILMAGAVTLSQSASFSMALLALAMMGAGYSIMNPATASGVAQWFPPSRRATAMGIKQTGVPLGGILGAGNGALVTVIGWQTIMLIIAGVAAVSILLYLGIAERPRRTTPTRLGHTLAELGIVMRDRNLGRFVAVNCLYNMGQASFYAYLALFMREAAQASQPVAGLCVGIAQAASAVSRIGWGVVCDLFFRGRRKTLVLILGAVGAVFLAAMATVGPERGVFVGAALSLLLGVTVAAYPALCQTMAVEATEPRLAGSAMGYNMLGTSFGGMIGPPIFGAVVDLTRSYDASWLMTAGWVVAGVLLLGFGFKERRWSCAPAGE